MVGTAQLPSLRARIQERWRWLNKLPFWVHVLIFVAIASLVPLAQAAEFSTEYWTSIGVSVLTFAMLGMGLNIVVGYAGLLDLGYAAFFAIGAYTTAVMTVKLGFNFWLSIIPAIAIAGTAGAILGYPTLRLRSDYLAIVTLGFGEIVRIIFQNWDYTDGPNGVWNIPPPLDPWPPTIAGVEISDQTTFYIIGVGLLLVALIGAHNLSLSRLGRRWLAVREDEFAAEAVGVPVVRTKLLAYVMGGMWAGLAGAFFASRVSAINPSSFTFALSAQVLVLIIIGGMGSLGGVLVGATLVVGVPELVRTVLPSVQQMRFLFFAAVLILVMLFRPQGIWPHVRSRDAPFVGLEEELQKKEAKREFKVEPAVKLGAPILKVDHLSHSFGGVLAVDDVSFEVYRGEIFSIIGPNGAGKTTVFNCVTGVQRRQRGEVEFNAGALKRQWGPIRLPLRPHEVVKRGMARTFQGIRLFKQMAVFENVMVGASVREKSWPWQAMLHSPAERRDQRRALHEARYWLRFVGLENVAGRLATQLPYADQRRVEVARALASEPILLLLDEPAAGMNPTEKVELMSMVKEIRKRGVTVVLIEHDMSVVMSISDRVAVLDQGRLIAEGAPAQIQANPRVIEAYLGRDEEDEEQTAEPMLGS